jgi:hypothetical protein
MNRDDLVLASRPTFLKMGRGRARKTRKKDAFLPAC